MSEENSSPDLQPDSKRRDFLTGKQLDALSRWAVFGFLIPLGLLAVLLLWPAQQTRTPSSRAECKNNLKQIGLALHNYHDAWGCFPPAYVTDITGKPLYSWRVVILPYMDQSALYNQFHLDESWDSPHNIKLLDVPIRGFQCPTAASKTANPRYSHYAAVVGPHCTFSPTGPVSLSDVTDGPSNTLCIGEVPAPGILWSKPEDITLTSTTGVNTPGGFGSHHEGGAQFLFADGHYKFLVDSISPADFHILATRDDGKLPSVDY